MRAVCHLMLVLFLAAGVTCADDFKQSNTPENLKALCQRIYSCIHQEKDLARATALFKGLIPNQERLKQAIKSDAKPEHVQAILELQAKFGKPTEREVSKMMTKDQSQVNVHGATTEEILRNAKDSVVYKEFPGGARRIAELVLKPNMKFYEVEFVAPGQESGMKFHLFYWDGKQWSMFGPAWRAVK